MKRLLVTGGSGFIGSNFIRYLLSDTDFDGMVINLDALTYAGNGENLLDLEKTCPDRYIFECKNIMDRPDVFAVFTKYDIDAVCHFAAESHVDRSIVRPDTFIQTNIVGTFNLLEAARAKGNRFTHFHHVSTDEVYGSLTDEGSFTEKTPYDPKSPYSASKAASDHLVRAFAHTYRLPVTISNCSNNFGPYQFPEKLIPLMVINALEGNPLPVYGDGRNVRDWLYVADHCRAIWKIMQHGRKGETYNIGGGCEMRNIDVVKTVCDILDAKAKPLKIGERRQLITFVKDRPGHDYRYSIDYAKLKTELGWTPSETFHTALDKTVDWYMGNMAWIDRIRSGEYRLWVSQQYGFADSGS